jgi:hypothetical protein
MLIAPEYSCEALVRARDQTIETIIRLMILSVGFGFLCAVIFGLPDSYLLSSAANINIPLLGPASIKAAIFLLPAVLIGVRIALHIYVNHLSLLDSSIGPRNCLPDPTVALTKNGWARVCAGFILYILTPLSVALLGYKVSVFAAWGPIAYSIAILIFVIQLSTQKKDIRRTFIGFCLVTCVVTISLIFIYDTKGLRRFELVLADLKRLDAEAADLRQANLWWARLSGANFKGAKLNEARFGGSDLKGANLKCADLSGAVLEAADLGGADFKGALLQHANLEDADLSGADFKSADLQHADLTDAKVSKAKFHFADLTDATISQDQKNNMKLCKTTMPDGVVSKRDCINPNEIRVNRTAYCVLILRDR